MNNEELMKWIKQDKLIQEKCNNKEMNTLLKRIITLTKTKVERDLYKRHKKDIIMLVNKIDDWERRFFKKNKNILGEK